MKIIKSIKRIIYTNFFLFLSFFIKKNNKNVILSAWHGNKFLDNTRYFAEYVVNKNSDLNLYWFGNEEIKEEVQNKLPNVTFVKKNTLKAYMLILKSKYIICSQIVQSDICNYNLYRKCVIIQCEHGIPIKKSYADAVGYTKKKHSFFKKIYNFLIHDNVKYSYFLSSSKENDKVYFSSYELDYNKYKDRILKIGTPRNDFLLKSNLWEHNNKKHYAEMLNFDLNAKVILYAPTWRRTENNIKSFSGYDLQTTQKIEEILEKHNAVILEKMHYGTNTFLNSSNSNSRIIRVGNELNVNVQEILLFTDILISDYSGIIYDFALTKKPQITYVYDLQNYKENDSGLYYELDDFHLGNVAYSIDDVLKQLDTTLSNTNVNSVQLNKILDKFLEYEKGECCEKLLSLILNDELKSI